MSNWERFNDQFRETFDDRTMTNTSLRQSVAGARRRQRLSGTDGGGYHFRM
jgi:hypothetical protein